MWDRGKGLSLAFSMESGTYGVTCLLYVNGRWVLKSSGNLKEARVKVEEELKKVTLQ